MLAAMYGHTVQTNLDIEHTSVGHAHACPTSISVQIFSSTNGTMQRLTFDVTVDDLQFVVQKSRLPQRAGRHSDGPFP